MSYAERYGPWGLIVGGSEGLGRALAGELGRRGINLVLAARRQSVLDEAAETLRAETGVEVRTVSVDAGEPDVARARIEQATADLEIGFFIYNCAAEHGGEFLHLRVADHLNHIAVNCITPTLLTHALGGRMVARGRGAVILCSSLAAMQGIYRWVSYGGSKAYELLLGEGLWDEFGQYGVNVCAFMIGSTYTPNFIRGQVERQTIFAKGREPENVPAGVQLPQLPEDAAANLFAQIDKQWLPLIYANPLDEARQKQLRQQERATVIRRMRDMQRSGYKSLLDEASALSGAAQAPIAEDH